LFVTPSGFNKSITTAMQCALPVNVNNLKTCRNPAAAAVIVDECFLNPQKKGILYLAYDFVAQQDL
jgi:hypothetical protein